MVFQLVENLGRIKLCAEYFIVCWFCKYCVLSYLSVTTHVKPSFLIHHSVSKLLAYFIYVYMWAG
jgi:hypothetical protein